MPPSKAPPKVFQIQVKTHKLSVFLTLPPSTTIISVKEEVLGALTADVNQGNDVPAVSALEDFELARGTKTKSSSEAEYKTLDTNKTIRDSGLTGWDALYIQFRDPTSGELLPVQVTEPSLEDDEDLPMDDFPSKPSSSKKRKGRDSDGE